MQITNIDDNTVLITETVDEINQRAMALGMQAPLIAVWPLLTTEQLVELGNSLVTGRYHLTVKQMTLEELKEIYPPK
jgi:hypothetical protein